MNTNWISAVLSKFVIEVHSLTPSRSSSREVLGVPSFFWSSTLVGEPSQPKKGVRKLAPIAGGPSPVLQQDARKNPAVQNGKRLKRKPCPQHPGASCSGGTRAECLRHIFLFLCLPLKKKRTIRFPPKTLVSSIWLFVYCFSLTKIQTIRFFPNLGEFNGCFFLFNKNTNYPFFPKPW